MYGDSEYINLFVESATSSYWGDCYWGGSISEQILLSGALYTNIHNNRNDYAGTENLYIIDESGTATNMTSIIGGEISNGSQASNATYPAIRCDNGGTGTSNLVIVNSAFYSVVGQAVIKDMGYERASHHTGLGLC